MTVNQTATRAGRKFQRDLTRFFRAEGFEADNLALSGAQDEGDLWVRTEAGVVVIEAKREKGFRPAEWVKQARAEQANYAKHRGLEGADIPGWAVVAARRNHPISESYVIVSLAEWLNQVTT